MGFFRKKRYKIEYPIDTGNQPFLIEKPEEQSITHTSIEIPESLHYIKDKPSEIKPEEQNISQQLQNDLISNEKLQNNTQIGLNDFEKDNPGWKIIQNSQGKYEIINKDPSKKVQFRNPEQTIDKEGFGVLSKEIINPDTGKPFIINGKIPIKNTRYNEVLNEATVSAKSTFTPDKFKSWNNNDKLKFLQRQHSPEIMQQLLNSGATVDINGKGTITLTPENLKYIQEHQDFINGNLMSKEDFLNLDKVKHDINLEAGRSWNPDYEKLKNEYYQRYSKGLYTPGETIQGSVNATEQFRDYTKAGLTAATGTVLGAGALGLAGSAYADWAAFHPVWNGVIQGLLGTAGIVDATHDISKNGLTFGNSAELAFSVAPFFKGVGTIAKITGLTDKFNDAKGTVRALNAMRKTSKYGGGYNEMSLAASKAVARQGASNNAYFNAMHLYETPNHFKVFGNKLASAAIDASAPVSKISELPYNIITHPVENIIAPQLTGYGIEQTMRGSNEYLGTNFSDKTIDLAGTYGGFTLGGLGVNYLKHKIGNKLLNNGYGYLLEGNTNFSNFLGKQLNTPWASGQGVRSFASNFNNLVVPMAVPGLLQTASYTANNKSLGENISNLTNGYINPTIGDIATETLAGAGSQAYLHNFWKTATLMSGGKKGFKNNKDYFFTYGGVDSKFAKKYPILNGTVAFGRLFTLNPRKQSAYRMTTKNQGLNTGQQLTNYTPADKKHIYSDVHYTNTWFDGRSRHLNNEMEQIGSFAVGNKDTSTGNIFEKLVKVIGGNDGRFEKGQQAHIFSTMDNKEQAKVLKTASFINPETKQYERIFLEDGSVNPNVKKALINSRSNLLLDKPHLNEKGNPVGTMLDVDGNISLRIKTEDGRHMNLTVDTQGPGSGAKDLISHIMSTTTSHQQVPGYFIGLSGQQTLKNQKGITKDVNKVQPHWTSATTDNHQILTYENIGSGKLREDGTREWNQYLESLYGDTPEWKTITDAKIKALDETIKNKQKYFTDGKYNFNVDKKLNPTSEQLSTQLEKKQNVEEKLKDLNFELSKTPNHGKNNKIKRKRIKKQIKLESEKLNQFKKLEKYQKLMREVNNNSERTLSNPYTWDLYKYFARKKLENFYKFRKTFDSNFGKLLKFEPATHRGIEVTSKVY